MSQHNGPETTGERMVSALRTAAGKQPHSRFVALGTRPADETHWFSRMLGGGCDYSQVHAARPDDPKFQRRTWATANPSMSHMPDLEAAIRAEAKQARQDPGLLAAFDALRLNRGTQDAVVSTLLDVGLWRAIEGTAERAGASVWGVDLGGRLRPRRYLATTPRRARWRPWRPFRRRLPLPNEVSVTGAAGFMSSAAGAASF